MTESDKFFFSALLIVPVLGILAVITSWGYDEAESAWKSGNKKAAKDVLRVVRRYRWYVNVFLVLYCLLCVGAVVTGVLGR